MTNNKLIQMHFYLLKYSLKYLCHVTCKTDSIVPYKMKKLLYPDFPQPTISSKYENMLINILVHSKMLVKYKLNNTKKTAHTSECKMWVID